MNSSISQLEQVPTTLSDLGFLREQEAARFLGTSVCTLWRFRKKGLRYYRIGGAIRYKIADLIEFVEASRT